MSATLEAPKTFVNRESARPEAPAKSFNHDLTVSADWLAERLGGDRKAILDGLANAGQPNTQQPCAASSSSSSTTLGTWTANGSDCTGDPGGTDNFDD